MNTDSLTSLVRKQKMNLHFLQPKSFGARPYRCVTLQSEQPIFTLVGSLLICLRIRLIFLIVPSVCSLTTAAEHAITRQPWTESRVQGSPDPPRPYIAQPVFENVRINNGLEMVAFSDRLFIVERHGKVWSFLEKDYTTAKTELFGDLKALHPQLDFAYGIAFHPKWQENQDVFVTYTLGLNPDDDTRLTRLSRFQYAVSDSGIPTVTPDTEEVILTWRGGGHNGANIRFGPDGLLYVSTGDAMPPNPPDPLNTGQDNSDLLSCVLRIDVDDPTEGNKYRIPPDNPFVNHENVRPEIWAFGFRNPWKMSFDSSGHLWLGDVGWELWEMIHHVRKGGNYGWSAMEASNPVNSQTVSDLAPISAPTVAHPHTEAASITGGFEYRGSRLPKLHGAYVYGDYETGILWALWHDGERVVKHAVIADTPHKISTFGTGNDGELYYIHYSEPSTIYQLKPNPRIGQSSDFPRKLSQTGLFKDVVAQVPANGVYEFMIHEPMWQDGAQATRFIGLPGESGIRTEIRYVNGYRRTKRIWPENAVLAKTIRVGETPVETQILHFDGDAWHGYSYRWNNETTDADLVDAAGEDFDLPERYYEFQKSDAPIDDDSNVTEVGWEGGPRYRILSRAECMRCHNMWNKFTPAFEPMQLARFAKFPNRSPQSVALGLRLSNDNFFYVNTSGQLVDSRSEGLLEKRARSWLHANCAHCHRRHGGGSTPLEVNFERTLSESATLWQVTTRGVFGLTDGRVIVPGAPWRSVLNYRVSSIDHGHMPPLGSREVDEHGASLLWQWVAGLPSDSHPHPADLKDISALLTDSSSAMQVAHAITMGEADLASISLDNQDAFTNFHPNIRALFERFRPAADRPLAGKLDPNRILAISGDPERGANLLSPTGKLETCLKCHKLGDEGVEIGPTFAKIGGRLSRQQLLESMIDPPKSIAPEYRLWSVLTEDGEVHSGIVADRNDECLTLKLANGKTQTIAVSEIEASSPQTQSIMPSGLLSALAEQEVADLLAYLSSLR